MSKTAGPDLHVLMDKKLTVHLNGGRSVTGILVGFDTFMNLVLDGCDAPLAGSSGAVEHLGSGVVIRGNSIVTIEPLEPVALRDG